jgi:hypothetical protein
MLIIMNGGCSFLKKQNLVSFEFFIFIDVLAEKRLRGLENFIELKRNEIRLLLSSSLDLLST